MAAARLGAILFWTLDCEVTHPSLFIWIFAGVNRTAIKWNRMEYDRLDGNSVEYN